MIRMRKLLRKDIIHLFIGSSKNKLSQWLPAFGYWLVVFFSPDRCIALLDRSLKKPEISHASVGVNATTSAESQLNLHSLCKLSVKKPKLSSSGDATRDHCTREPSALPNKGDYVSVLIDLNLFVHFSCNFVYLPKSKSVEHTQHCYRSGWMLGSG